MKGVVLSDGKFAILVVLLVVLIILGVVALWMLWRTRQAAEDAAERAVPSPQQFAEAVIRVLGDPNRELGDLVTQLRDGFVAISHESARRAVEDTGEHIVRALGGNDMTALPAEPQHPEPHATGQYPPQGADWTHGSDRQPASTMDHPGARAQLAMRAGRPLPDGPHAGNNGESGYQVVRTGDVREILPGEGSQGEVEPYDLKTVPYQAPPPDPDDTAIFSKLGPDGRATGPDTLPEPLEGETEAQYLLRAYGGQEPPNFHASHFQRKPSESESDFEIRLKNLKALYDEWLALSTRDVTGGFPLGIGYTAAARDALMRQ